MWLQEPETPKPVAKAPEPAKAEAKTIPALKPIDTPTAKSMPAKVQEPMYTKAATPKIVKVFKKENYKFFKSLSY